MPACRAPSRRISRAAIPPTNAAALSALLDGQHGAYRDIVLLNSAAALLVAGKAKDLQRRRGTWPPRAIDSGWRRAACSQKLIAIADTVGNGRADERHPRPRSAPTSARMSRAARPSGRWRDSRPPRASASPPRGFADRLAREVAQGRYGLIAEIKKASPSQRADPRRFRSRRPGQRLRGRRRHLPVGADRRALFPGPRRRISRPRAPPWICRHCARTSCSIPTRSSKPRALGADCILLIMAALADAQAAELEAAAVEPSAWMCWSRCMTRRAGARAQAEVAAHRHQQPQPEDLAVDLATTEQLAPMVPAGPAARRRERPLHPRRSRAHAQGRRQHLPGRRVPDAAGRRGGGDPRPARPPRRRLAQRIEPAMARLTHFDAQGKAAMVDVTGKDVTERTATAKGSVLMQPETIALITGGGVKKGDVLSVARLAGIMGAKRTPDLIPLCHPAGADLGRRSISPSTRRATPSTSPRPASSKGQTGVEMEALTAVAVAALTVYDMCKAVDRGMRIADIRLVAEERRQVRHLRGRTDDLGRRSPRAHPRRLRAARPPSRCPHRRARAACWPRMSSPA